jgi:hypothetical protein
VDIILDRSRPSDGLSRARGRFGESTDYDTAPVIANERIRCLVSTKLVIVEWRPDRILNRRNLGEETQF